jgi:hypothetical protein
VLSSAPQIADIYDQCALSILSLKSSEKHAQQMRMGRGRRSRRRRTTTTTRRRTLLCHSCNKKFVSNI